MKLCFRLLFLTFLLVQNHSNCQIVTTLAGNGASGSQNGLGTNSQFFNPRGLAVDSAGNILVADSFNHMIRKITPTGTVSKVAGIGANNPFNFPVGITVDSSGNIYVGDTLNNCIRKVLPGGSVTILAGSSSPGSTDSTGTKARFSSPMGVIIDSLGNIYVADQGNSRIRKVTSAGVVTTFAGSTVGSTDGQGTNAKFNYPRGIAIDSNRNLYVADTLNYKIRKISVGGTVSTLAGGSSSGFADGAGTSAFFKRPTDLSVDIIGNIYVADNDSFTIRKVTPSGAVTTIAGKNLHGYNDGIGSNALFNAPSNIARGLNGELYISDINNQRIRKLNLSLTCPPGTFISDTCYDCIPGTYSEVINSTSCLSCPPGTFSSAIKSTSCLDCPIGSFCPIAGSSNSIACTVNRYCPWTGMALPLDCPANSTNSYVGSQSVDDCICDPGFYKNSTTCSECPAGFYCPWNSTSASTCPPGYFCPLPQLSLPTMCPQGYYCPETGLSIALQCVENSGTLGPGSIDCICDQGYFLSNGSCIYNVTTTIETLESSTYSLNSDLESSTDSSKNDYPLMTSPVTTDAPSNSKFTAYTSLSDLKPHGHSIHSDRVSSYKTTTGTVRNTDGIVGLALSNPLAMSIVLVTSVVMMIAIFNVCRAEIRLAKVRDMRKKGIIANFADNDGLQTSGDTTFADNGADA